VHEPPPHTAPARSGRDEGSRAAPGVRYRVSSLASQLVHRLDLVQRRNGFLGFPWAVLRKYLDDEGPRLAALITYYGFLSLFPLLLLATTAVTELLRSQPELQQQMLDQLVKPTLRPDVEQAISQLPPSGVPLAVGLVSLLFAGIGGVLAVYSVLNKMWGVPWRDRFGLTGRYARALLVLVLALVSAVIAAGSTILTDTVLELPWVQRAAAAVATATAVFAVIGIAHKVLVCRPLRIRDVCVGGAIGAIIVTVLLNAAATILPALVTRAGLVYGSFATAVGIFTLLYLVSQTLVLSVEVSTVIESRLWPRGLTTTALSEADRRALVLQARRQERVAGERIVTTFSTRSGEES
jgi:YihY family inner membrane protein